MHVLIGFAVIIFALLLAGIVYQQIGIAHDQKEVLPFGKLVPASGGVFHVNCMGQGAVTVILESGISASSLSWANVQAEVAKFARVVSYDRAGFGWSDRRKQPRVPLQLAQELHLMLAGAGLTPPYLLVGHSFGGMITRAYAAQFPQEVCGMVLVDALHPAEWAHPSPSQKRTLLGGVLLSHIGALLCSIGVVRLCVSLAARGKTRTGKAVLHSFGPQVAQVVNRIVGEITKLPPQLLRAVRVHWTQPKSFLTQADYFARLPESSREVLDLKLPSEMPLIVLSADSPLSTRNDEQKQLAQLCAGAEHIIVPDCGHWIHLDRADLVISAISKILQMQIANRQR